VVAAGVVLAAGPAVAVVVAALDDDVADGDVVVADADADDEVVADADDEVDDASARASRDVSRRSSAKLAHPPSTAIAISAATSPRVLMFER
jgi:hypothetical protein